MKSFWCFFVDFEKVDVSWECAFKNTKTSAEHCSDESQTTMRHGKLEKKVLMQENSKDTHTLIHDSTQKTETQIVANRLQYSQQEKSIKEPKISTQEYRKWTLTCIWPHCKYP